MVTSIIENFKTRRRQTEHEEYDSGKIFLQKNVPREIGGGMLCVEGA